jgi:hypothetical protein
MSRMMNPFAAAWIAGTVAGAGAIAGVDPPEEFAGPLAGWREVRRDYGARGDGAADDGLILDLLRPLREVRLGPSGPAPVGATDVRLRRVIVSAGKDGVAFEVRR